MSSRQSENLTTADFFTSAHHIRAQVQTGPRPLSDLLNDRSQSYLLVFNFRLSALDEARESKTRGPEAYLSKENLCFVLVSSREARAPERGRYAVLERQILVTLPGFEVRGTFLGPLRSDLWNFTPATLDPFVVLTEATVLRASAPELTFEADVALVSRARVESFCLLE
jgi:hypothetical protein